MRLKIPLIFIIIPLVLSMEAIDDEHYRTKRQLNSLPIVYPYGGTIRFILGFVMPVPNEDMIGVIFGASFLYQYNQIQNISDISKYYPIKTISREQREAEWDRRRDERLTFYKAVEELLNVKGFHGRECVLRAICEAAQFPLEHEALFGEILHIILTPNYGRSALEDDASWWSSMGDYVDAYTAGRQMFSCHYLYSGCPEGEGLLELVSLLKDEDNFV
ncbi:unnamed protein product [Plutella xylostella]|uniref:(diamondback moth) hypothetical protein n=1 Tax=Plutella xylostella TaxID=51655 RepID=A0A8S4FU21_PLUXY|nr:unnamed protein product [Plutella xylostella]